MTSAVDGPTLPRLLADRAATRTDHPFVVCDGDVLTYAQASARSAELAKGLLARDVGKGTRVGLLHPNGTDFVVASLAAARIGAVCVPLSTFSTSPELHTLLLGADVEILLATPSHRGRDLGASIEEVRPALPALRHVVLDHDELRAAGDAVADARLHAMEAAVRPDDRLVIVHTSGSTSEPKGVIHQHGSLLRHLAGLDELRRYGEEEVLFSTSPFFWIGGFAYTLLGTLLAGATLVTTNAADASAALDLLERTRPTMVNGFAAAVAHYALDPTFADRDLSSIRRGNLWPIMPPEVRPADPELRHNLLGMTEAGSVCLASGDEGEQPENRRGSFGRPVPGLEARVVDPETGGDRPVGEVGELWLRGPNLMEGYDGRERYTTFTPDDWFATGDLFHTDADGFFYFHGRRGDLIKTAGANVAPREVEAAIAEVAGLTAHVIGLEDAERGQIVAAAVRVPGDGRRPDEEELRTALRARLSAYKVPRRFVFLTDEEVPMLSSGKVDPSALRARLHAG